MIWLASYGFAFPGWRVLLFHSFLNCWLSSLALFLLWILMIALVFFFWKSTSSILHFWKYNSKEMYRVIEKEADGKGSAFSYILANGPCLAGLLGYRNIISLGFQEPIHYSPSWNNFFLKCVFILCFFFLFPSFLHSSLLSSLLFYSPSLLTYCCLNKPVIWVMGF